jgi:hypothetical protein
MRNVDHAAARGERRHCGRFSHHRPLLRAGGQVRVGGTKHAAIDSKLDSCQDHDKNRARVFAATAKLCLVLWLAGKLRQKSAA